MSDQPTYRIAGTNVPGCKMLYCQVLPNGASTPTIGENKGNVIASVAWSATGVIIVTLNDAYLAADAFLTLRLATGADTQVQLKSFTAATTKLLTINILTAGSLADIAAAAGNIIGILIVARDSSAQ